MKSQKPFLAIAVVLLTSIAAFGSPLDQSRRVRLQRLRASPIHVRLTLLERAYLDTAGILDLEDGCSQFFGGTDSARVLDEFVVRLQERSFNDSRTGLRMSGSFELHVNEQNGVLYRLFEDADLNSTGPFYRSKNFPAEPFVPNVGSFRPNTRQARVLILLHELAHLIRSSNGPWLIPDDGGNAQLSRFNTLTVESKCKQQIRSL